jgi:hypothetical protein
LGAEALDRMSDAEARQVLARQRGLGEWSIEYFLARGLGRPDCLPAGDVGLRRVVGRYLSGGARLSAEELRGVLEPFAPYRSLPPTTLPSMHAFFGRSPLQRVPYPLRRSRDERRFRLRPVLPDLGARGAGRSDLR